MSVHGYRTPSRANLPRPAAPRSCEEPPGSAVEAVPVDLLLPAGHGRSGRGAAGPVAGAGQGDGRPVVVHRGTMRVIVGAAVLYAARARGARTVDVRFFDGSLEEALTMAAESALALPAVTTPAQRAAEAARLLRAHPQWSDRAVAAAAGVSPKTVAAHRARLRGTAAAPQKRIGLDGRARPLSSAEGRALAGRLLLDAPGASLREIASRAGISPATVRDVRERLKRGENPVPPGCAPSAAQVRSRPSGS
ncbi:MULTISPECIES: helix-turn-helix domain-containing protein [Streptomyces]|uniref:CreG n=1 Tax=Streptomyces cremeus TaxID=66881 RepID=A0A0K2JL85_STRCM|nr:CreG [Streptomyces cremeus]